MYNVNLVNSAFSIKKMIRKTIRIVTDRSGLLQIQTELQTYKTSQINLWLIPVMKRLPCRGIP